MKWIHRSKEIFFLAVFICWKLISFGQNNAAISKPDTLKVQIKLTKVEESAGCGVFAITVAQKFELLVSGQSSIPKKYIIVLQQCPELLGRDFFVKGQVYNALLTLARESDVTLNSYRNENLPTYSCSQIQHNLK